MFHKSAAPVTAVGAGAAGALGSALGSVLGHASPRGGGSPLHAGGAGAAGAAATAASNANVEEDEVSEYTDADESISAPTEFLAEVSFGGSLRGQKLGQQKPSEVDVGQLSGPSEMLARGDGFSYCCS